MQSIHDMQPMPRKKGLMDAFRNWSTARSGWPGVRPLEDAPSASTQPAPQRTQPVTHTAQAQGSAQPSTSGPESLQHAPASKPASAPVISLRPLTPVATQQGASQTATKPTQLTSGTVPGAALPASVMTAPLGQPRPLGTIGPGVTTQSGSAGTAPTVGPGAAKPMPRPLPIPIFPTNRPKPAANGAPSATQPTRPASQPGAAQPQRQPASNGMSEREVLAALLRAREQQQPQHQQQIFPAAQLLSSSNPYLWPMYQAQLIRPQGQQPILKRPGSGSISLQPVRPTGAPGTQQVVKLNAQPGSGKTGSLTSGAAAAAAGRTASAGHKQSAKPTAPTAGGGQGSHPPGLRPIPAFSNTSSSATARPGGAQPRPQQSVQPGSSQRPLSSQQARPSAGSGAPQQARPATVKVEPGSSAVPQAVSVVQPPRGSHAGWKLHGSSVSLKPDPGSHAQPSGAGAGTGSPAGADGAAVGSDGEGRGKMRVRMTVRRQDESDWRQKVALNLITFMSKKTGGEGESKGLPILNEWSEAAKHNSGEEAADRDWESEGVGVVRGQAAGGGLIVEAPDGKKSTVLTLLRAPNNKRPRAVMTNEKRELRANPKSPSPIYKPEPLKGAGGGRGRGKGRGRPKRQEGEGAGKPGAVATYAPLLARVKAQLAKMRHEEHLVQTYEADGWKGRSRERVQLTGELKAALASLRRRAEAIRAAVRACDETPDLEAIPAECFDGKGELSAEHIFCAVCKDQECDDDNDIILCDGECRRAFHCQCVDPPLGPEEIEGEEWLCPACACKEDILEELNANFGTHYQLDTPWQDILTAPKDPGPTSPKSPTAQGQLNLSNAPWLIGGDSPTDDDMATGDAEGSDSGDGSGSDGDGGSGDRAVKRPRRSKRVRKPAKPGAHGGGGGGLLDIEWPSDDESDADYDVTSEGVEEKGGKARRRSKSGDGNSEEGGSDEGSSDEGEGESGEGESDEGSDSEEGSEGSDSSDAGGSEAGGDSEQESSEEEVDRRVVLAAGRKRRRTAVNYVALNEAMFGAADRAAKAEREATGGRGRRAGSANGAGQHDDSDEDYSPDQDSD